MAFLLRRLRLWTTIIRDGFVALLPLTLIGAVAIAVANNPHPAYLAWMNGLFGHEWQTHAQLAIDATIGIMGLACTFTIALRLTAILSSRKDRSDTFVAAVGAVAAAAFLMVVLKSQGSSMRPLGYASILQSVLVGVIVAELMTALDKLLPRHDRLGNLESGASMQTALRASMMGAFVILLIALTDSLVRQALLGLGQAAFHPIDILLSEHSPGPLWLNTFLVITNQLLWSVGINGGQVLLHLADQGAPYIAPPQVLYAQTAASPMFVNAFAHLGGGGATWGLIFATLLFGKDPVLRRLAWFSLLPAVLNVNELLLFGIPLVFGRALLVPFILAPTVICLMAALAVNVLGMPLQGQAVAWSTPVLVSGYLMTGTWIGAAVQGVGLVLATAMYWPFLRRLEAQRRQQSQRLLKEAIKAMTVPTQAPTQLLLAPSPIGDIARGLLEDFEADLGTSRVCLAYQPQHDIHGRVVGVEALLRWTHAEHGAIPPAAIINIAEDTQTIHRIGAWLVNQACADMAIWQRAGLRGFKVAINMSPAQLEDIHWVHTVRQALSDHFIAPACLEIEITEGRMMSSSLQADHTLVALQALGVPLSMDDFGMGCTSLLYMQRFKMHAIKLDGALTRNVVNNAVSQDIIRSVARLGQLQGVDVVAEFVETVEQRQLLAALGCTCFQGWLYSAAMPAADIPAYLGQQACTA